MDEDDDAAERAQVQADVNGLVIGIKTVKDFAKRIGRLGADARRSSLIPC